MCRPFAVTEPDLVGGASLGAPLLLWWGWIFGFSGFLSFAIFTRTGSVLGCSPNPRVGGLLWVKSESLETASWVWKAPALWLGCRFYQMLVLQRLHQALLGICGPRGGEARRGENGGEVGPGSEG